LRIHRGDSLQGSQDDSKTIDPSYWRTECE
jgi:hypothetical protein